MTENEQATKIAEYSQTEAALSHLREKYQGAEFEVGKPKGLKAAKAARSELRGYRTELERTRKDIKAPALERCRLIDTEAKRITAELTALEDPIAEQIRVEEQRAERERQAKIEAEQRRVEAIQARLDEIRNAAEPIAWDSSAADVNVVVKSVQALEIDESFEEFRDQAKDAKDAVLGRLRDMAGKAEEREEAEERAAEERAELERLRAEQAEREAKEAAERKDREEKARKKREAEDAKRRAKLKAEEDLLAVAKKRQARRDEVRNQIHVLRQLPMRAAGQASVEQARILARAESFSIELTDDETDLREELQKARTEAVASIEATLAERKQFEADQAELEQQRKDRERAEAEAAERDRKAKAAAKKRKYPGEAAIVEALAQHFGVPVETVREWLTELRSAA